MQKVYLSQVVSHCGAKRLDFATVGDQCEKKRFSVNVESEQYDECHGMADKMSMSMSTFLRIVTAVGCEAIRENPEVLLKVTK